MGIKSERRKERNAQPVNKVLEKFSQDQVRPKTQNGLSFEGNQGPRLKKNLEVQNDLPRTGKPLSRFPLKMTWCDKEKDIEGEWSWHEPRAWTSDDWDKKINSALTKFKMQTWGEIDRHVSGSGHKMHHEQELATLTKEAQRRWRDRGLEQFETAFRFRIGGQKCHAWGFILKAHFHLVWYERYHKIYPTKKKNT